MKKLLILSVLLALFAGGTSYAQGWPFTAGGSLTKVQEMHQTSSDFPSEPPLVNEVFNPVVGYRSVASVYGPAGSYIQGGDSTAPDADRTYMVAIATLTGIDSANDFYGYDDDWIGGGGVVEVDMGTGFDWTLYSDVSFEFREEYADGSWDWYYVEWSL